MKKLLLFLIIPFLSSGQDYNLLPSIGLDNLPNDSDIICEIIPVAGNNGIPHDIPGPGDIMSDFTLYDYFGNEYNMENELMNGKHILLVTGSYTCPKFRNQIESLNEVEENYGELISSFVIYTVEAHPLDPDISPYSGEVWPSGQNTGIEYNQPETYGERKSIVFDLINSEDISVPVLIDGPCNEWWMHYTNRPNSAILIENTGIIYNTQQWFDDQGSHINCDILSMLNENVDDCENVDASGTFNFNLVGDSIVYGLAGETIFAYGELVNNSDAPVEIKVKRIFEDVPFGWQTSLCTNICLLPTIDTDTVYLDVGETANYTMYFYTNEVPGTGSVTMRFRNLNQNSNSFKQDFICITESVGTSELEESLNPGILKSIDLLGRDPSDNKGLQLHIYDDGSVEKKYLIQ